MTPPGNRRPLNGLCVLIGMEFYPIRDTGSEARNETAGIHLDTPFGHQLGDVLVGERPVPGRSDRFVRALVSPVSLIDTEFYPIRIPVRIPAPKFATEPAMLSLDFADGSTMQIMLAGPTSSVMVRDKDRKLEYAD
jgi:hypothetical protein